MFMPSFYNHESTNKNIMGMCKSVLSKMPGERTIQLSILQSNQFQIALLGYNVHLI